MSDPAPPPLDPGALGNPRDDAFTAKLLTVLREESKQGSVFFGLFNWMEQYKPLGGWLRSKRLAIRRRLEGSTLALELAVSPQSVAAVFQSADPAWFSLLRPPATASLEDSLRLIARKLDMFLDMPRPVVHRSWILGGFWLLAAVCWIGLTAVLMQSGAAFGPASLGILSLPALMLLGYFVAADYERWRSTMHAQELYHYMRRQLSLQPRIAEAELLATLSPRPSGDLPQPAETVLPELGGSLPAALGNAPDQER